MPFFIMASKFTSSLFFATSFVMSVAGQGSIMNNASALQVDLGYSFVQGTELVSFVPGCSLLAICKVAAFASFILYHL